MSQNNKDIMHVRERRDKHGELSFVLYCSGKDPVTRKNKVYVKTYKVPADYTGKKEIATFRLECQIAWKQEVDKIGTGALITKNNKIKFIDFAREWTENIMTFNKEAYSYFRSSKSHLKDLELKLGSYYLHEMTPPVIQEFCKWLCNRTFIKYKYIVIDSLKPLIDERKISLRKVAESCNISHATLFVALQIGKAVSKETVTSLCKFLNASINKYFKVEKEEVFYSHSSNNGLKVMLHGVLHEAVRQGLIDHNYASKEYIRPVKGTDKKSKEIFDNNEDIQQFVKCIDLETDMRKKIAFSICINLGLRISELVGLEWKDIDLDKNEIIIRRNCIYVSGFGTKTKSTKTKTSERTISLPIGLTNLIKQYREYWDIEKINHGDLWEFTDRLFVQNNGKDMAGSTVAKWLKAFELQHNLKPVTSHGLRHTNITMQINNGVDIKTVSARAGHNDIKTTLNIYSHYTSEADKQAANVINDLLSLN